MSKDFHDWNLVPKLLEALVTLLSLTTINDRFPATKIIDHQLTSSGLLSLTITNPIIVGDYPSLTIINH